MTYETEFQDASLNVRKGQCAIYALSAPDESERGTRYIGKTTSSVESRRRDHARDAKNPNRRETHLHRWLASLTARGVEPVALMLELCEQNGLNDAERWWIARGRELGWDLVNTAEGGTGGRTSTGLTTRSGEAGRKAWATRRARGKGGSPLKGVKQDPEFAARRLAAIDHDARLTKMRATLAERKAAGIPHPNTGKPSLNKGVAMSEATRQKIREARALQEAEGRTPSAETRSAAAKKAWDTRRAKAASLRKSEPATPDELAATKHTRDLS